MAHHEMDEGAGLIRRQLLQRALALVGAAAVAAPLEALAAPAAGSARYFDADRFAILDAVAETIMPRTDTPGARDAGVPAKFDSMMLTWASAAHRIKYGQTLDDIDRAARAQAGDGLARLPADKQLAVMTAYDKAKFRDPQYRDLKQLILTLYYMSEPGATQELRYQHTPGAWIPSLKVTPDTRAWAVDIGF